MNDGQGYIVAGLVGLAAMQQWEAVAVAAVVVLYGSIMYADDQACGGKGVYIDEVIAEPVPIPRGAC